jgi:hypothetical protein
MNWMLMLLKGNADALSIVDGDGHTLYNPEYLIKKGYPVDFVRNITERHESDYSSGKSTIFDKDGKPVDTLLAVAALTFHYAVASQLNLEGGKDYELYNGRGFQARAIAEAIRKAVNPDV